MNLKEVVAVRAIHYSIRYAIVLIMILLFYLILAFLFHQTVQLPVIITLPLIVICAERMWVLLDWIGPVVGTMNKKKQEQERKLIIEYLLENSLRYGSPLVIAAICGKKRMSLHVVARLLRKTDIVLRSSVGYLLVLLPFTSFEQAPVALRRLITRQLPISGVFMTDVHMLQDLVEAQRTDGNGEATGTTVQDLRRICLRSFDEKIAAIKSNSARAVVPPIYSLFESGASETLFSQLKQLNSSTPEMDALPAAKGESSTNDSR
ncbi:MAG TPA: hypothetical protein VNE61_11700 [Ktedonobacteraceae bacterium]|nr:hypothetical protein [Ktedonobacteraceae bacterium]